MNRRTPLSLETLMIDERIVVDGFAERRVSSI